LAQKGYEWLTELLVKWRADGKIDIMKRIAAYAQKELQAQVDRFKKNALEAIAAAKRIIYACTHVYTYTMCTRLLLRNV